MSRISIAPLQRAPSGPGASRAGPIRPSRNSRVRAIVLVCVHLAIVAHVVQWKLTGSTISPVEPSEAMQTLEQGRVNAGFFFFLAAIVATLLFGRFFCGWACHVVALQDLCGALMKRAGIRPRPFRSRLLAWIPAALAVYMFVWPTLRREVIAPIAGSISPIVAKWVGTPAPFPGFSMHLVETNFWQTFPGVAVAVPFLLVCGFVVVYFFGAKGFCTYGCPYGGVFGPVDRLAPGKIVVDLDACEGCGHCTARCTSNVRVHEEIKTYGMVVDSGCMKCMDCVSVCPNDALSFGFRKPTLLAKRLDGTARGGRRASKRRYDLRAGEEVILALVFLATFLVLRGAYGLIPLLMAVGAALTLTFLAWIALRLVRDAAVSVHRTTLKHAGRLSWTGAVTLIGAAVLAVLISHTSVVRYHLWRGDRLDRRVTLSREAVLAGSVEIEASVRGIAERARQHYRRARGIGEGGIGLVDTPEIALRCAWLDLVAGERERALGTLEKLMRVRPSEPLAMELGSIVRAIRGGDAELEFQLGVLGVHPDYDRVREASVRALLDAGRPGEAVALHREYVEAHPLDADAHARMGSIHLAARRDADAVASLERAVDLSPDQSSLHHDLAVALFVAGRWEEALGSMERALSLSGGDRALRERLGEMRRRVMEERQRRDLGR